MTAVYISIDFGAVSIGLHFV